MLIPNDADKDLFEKIATETDDIDGHTWTATTGGRTHECTVKNGVAMKFLSEKERGEPCYEIVGGSIGLTVYAGRTPDEILKKTKIAGNETDPPILQGQVYDHEIRPLPHPGEGVDLVWPATKGVIMQDDGRILLLREAQAYQDGTQTGRWDVVGGRAAFGEPFKPKENLRREALEESGLEIVVHDVFFTDVWMPEKGGKKWKIVGRFFRCIASTSEVQLSPDHDEYAWIFPREYQKYALMPGYKNLFEAYLKMSRNQGV